MDDAEGGLSFDFEGGLDAAIPSASASAAAAPSAPTASAAEPAPSGNPAAHSSFAPAAAASESAGFRGGGGGGGGRSFRQTVCRHWLRSLCMKGDACGFLHQFDKARMPICRFFRLYGECREQDCVYKHTNEDIKECNMYKLGFCPNGPDCRYRHAKMPGPPPSVEEVLQKIQQLASYGYGSSNRFFQSRNQGAPQQTEKSQISQGPNNVNQGVTSKNAPAESTNHHLQPIQQPQQQNPPGGPPNVASRGPALLPPGVSRYFIVKSCNRENLELSVQQGVWATQRSNEPKLNEAFDSVENVILIFSVNRTRHFQGCAKMTSRIGGAISGGNWKYAHGTPHYGRNFSVKWLKLCELSFQKTRHLCNPYNENLPVKISRDCQELEPSIGEQLASLLFLEPDSDLMAVSLSAEAKREEEKAKGLNTDSGSENPDIVPFEYNEEEEEEEDEEEESEEEEEEGGYSALPGVGPFMGRGRGRGGLMWPPPMPLARGTRPPMPGMRGFPPAMMGPDGYSYGDGFGMPDPFGVGPRPFPPFGPRFPGDFSGPASGMMFPGRPMQPGSVFPGGGFGMMMGPGRGPFMGGNPGRGGRPMGMPPPLMPQNFNRMVKRDQRAPGNDRFSAVTDQGMDQESMGPGEGNGLERPNPLGAKARNEDQFGAGNSFRNDDSESEDEAPRRSRHGEGKKKRRGSEADGAASTNL